MYLKEKILKIFKIFNEEGSNDEVLKSNKNNKYVWIIVIIFVLIVSIIFLIFLNIRVQKIYNNSKNQVLEVKKSNKINKFKNNLENIYQEKDFDNKYSFITTYNNQKYKTYIFDYKTGETLQLDDIVCKKFYQELISLINLKYPKFIANKLALFDHDQAVIFNEDNLTIYFYDYDIIPKIDDELKIDINYNDISPYLKFNVPKSINLNSIKNGSEENLKYVAFTFDDGPSIHTKNLINILNDNKANATFFIVGNRIKNNIGVLNYMKESNNEIGYHSLNHKSFIKQPISIIKEDFDFSNSLLNDSFGLKFNLIRPPYGQINKEILNNINNPFILWSLDPEDWKYHNKERTFNYILENIKPGDIVLFHDLYKETIDAIELLLPVLYSKGYRVVTVSKLAQIYDKQIISNNIYRCFSK